LLREAQQSLERAETLLSRSPLSRAVSDPIISKVGQLSQTHKDHKWETQVGTDGFAFRLYSMTTRQERFRTKAIDCYVAAQKAKDRQAKKTYLELMSGWRELARYVEEIEDQHKPRLVRARPDRLNKAG
jgi:hypothetical protein